MIENNIKALQQKFAKPGEVEIILVRTTRLGPVSRLQSVLCVANIGLEGDRYHNAGGSRQVTLIQQEHLNAVSSFLGRPVYAEMVRRNIVVKGINLLSLKGKKFRIGNAQFEYSGECHPCTRMETALGEGGYNAMRGHGGVTAKVIEGGLIKVGDSIIPV